MQNFAVSKLIESYLESNLYFKR